MLMLLKPANISLTSFIKHAISAWILTCVPVNNIYWFSTLYTCNFTLKFIFYFFQVKLLKTAHMMVDQINVLTVHQVPTQEIHLIPNSFLPMTKKTGRRSQEYVFLFHHVMQVRIMMLYRMYILEDLDGLYRKGNNEKKL